MGVNGAAARKATIPQRFLERVTATPVEPGSGTWGPLRSRLERIAQAGGLRFSQAVVLDALRSGASENEALQRGAAAPPLVMGDYLDLASVPAPRPSEEELPRLRRELEDRFAAGDYPAAQSTLERALVVSAVVLEVDSLEWLNARAQLRQLLARPVGGTELEAADWRLASCLSILGAHHPSSRLALSELLGLLPRWDPSAWEWSLSSPPRLETLNRFSSQVRQALARAQQRPDFLPMLDRALGAALEMNIPGQGVEELAAQLRYDQGSYGGLKPSFDRIIARLGAQLGSSHPWVLQLRLQREQVSVAEEQRHAGYLASSTKRELFAIETDLESQPAPSVLSLVHKNAAALRAHAEGQREPSPASIMAGAVEDARRLWGDNHPVTLQAMSNLASLTLDAGERVGLRREVLARSRAVLSDDDPDLLEAVHQLAAALSEEPEPSPELLELQEEVVARATALLGTDHGLVWVASEELDAFQARMPTPSNNGF